MGREKKAAKTLVWIRALRLSENGAYGKRVDADEALFYFTLSFLTISDPITFMADDCEKLENIKQLLMTEEASLQRKNLVLMYLQRVSYD